MIFCHVRKIQDSIRVHVYESGFLLCAGWLPRLPGNLCQWSFLSNSDLPRSNLNLSLHKMSLPLIVMRASVYLILPLFIVVETEQLAPLMSNVNRYVLPFALSAQCPVIRPSVPVTISALNVEGIQPCFFDCTTQVQPWSSGSDPASTISPLCTTKYSGPYSDPSKFARTRIDADECVYDSSLEPAMMQTGA